VLNVKDEKTVSEFPPKFADFLCFEQRSQLFFCSVRKRIEKPPHCVEGQFINGEVYMAYAFAQGGNEQLPQKREGVRDLEWFKTQLRNAGVSQIHIIWNAAEEFLQVEPVYQDCYLHHRKHLLHRQALERAQREYQEMENQPSSLEQF
jgi:hypothetical protein